MYTIFLPKSKYWFMLINAIFHDMINIHSLIFTPTKCYLFNKVSHKNPVQYSK